MKSKELEDTILNLMSCGDNTARKILDEYKKSLLDDIKPTLEHVDQILSTIEDTVKGQEGDAITKARGLLLDYIF